MSQELAQDEDEAEDYEIGDLENGRHRALAQGEEGEFEMDDDTSKPYGRSRGPRGDVGEENTVFALNDSDDDDDEESNDGRAKGKGKSQGGFRDRDSEDGDDDEEEEEDSDDEDNDRRKGKATGKGEYRDSDDFEEMEEEAPVLERVGGKGRI